MIREKISPHKILALVGCLALVPSALAAPSDCEAALARFAAERGWTYRLATFGTDEGGSLVDRTQALAAHADEDVVVGSRRGRVHVVAPGLPYRHARDLSRASQRSPDDGTSVCALVAGWRAYETEMRRLRVTLALILSLTTASFLILWRRWTRPPPQNESVSARV